MALKDQKPRMFSTYWDIVSMAQQIATEKIDVSEQLPELFNVVKFKAQLEQFIIQVDAMIWAKLRRYYDLDVLLGAKEDSRVSVPTPHVNNQGDSELISVLLNNSSASDVRTATWMIQFRSPTEYRLYSSLEGLQGTGWEITDLSNTSNNGEITIQNDFWIENLADFVRGDRFFFSVHRVHPLIQFISNLLATSLAMTSIYTSETPNWSEFGKALWQRGMTQIHQIVLAAEGQGILKGMNVGEDGSGLLVGASLDDFVPDWDLSTINIDYEVTDLGQDRSPYLTDQFGQYMFPEEDSNPYIG
jgi:hypothetical protein